ncbi:hypothetical protein [Shewanella sp. SM95]|uniref:hypothetical protein n=1 Tax=Shewanella sp. SM95 TaxID=2912812 RepID=UPI0021D98B49|nr:hypothetical protein [Shewanella sp. SM95]MCU8000167.1 hypothetical protein [Shewanella sp. SM95]
MKKVIDKRNPPPPPVPPPCRIIDYSESWYEALRMGAFFFCGGIAIPLQLYQWSIIQKLFFN